MTADPFVRTTLPRINFEKAINRVLPHEGGFTRNPADPGNWTGGKVGRGQLKGTKFGISAAAYPHLDIKNLTWGQASEIYYRDFWSPLHAGRLHDGVAYQLLDFAINSGIRTAIRAYQRALRVTDDGIFGPQSLAAAEAMSETDQIMLLLAERLDWMASLSIWQTFGRGWARRIAKNLRYGAEDS